MMGRLTFGRRLIAIALILALGLGLATAGRRFTHWPLLGSGLQRIFDIRPPSTNTLSQVEIQETQSVRQLRIIAQIALGYKSDHRGVGAQSLQELMAAYNSPDFVGLCFAPGRGGKSKMMNGSRGTLDDRADYILSPGEVGGVIAFERPGLWPDGLIGVAFADEGGAVKVVRMKPEDLERHGVH